MRKWNGLKVRPTTSTVSKRKFNYASEERIANLKQIRLKKKSEAKIDWAVSAYIDWRSDRLERFQYDPAIYFADLTQLDTLQKDNLNHTLCRFIPEVTKKRGEGEYPGATLYQMIVAIQRFLVVNKVKWHLLDDLEFDDMRTVLDNVMRERTAKNIGVVKKQAGLITFEHEESLWDQGVLGEDTPDKFRNTVLFLLGINAHLRAVEEHYYLRRDTPEEKGQLSFMSNPRGVRCVVYQEDSITKTHDGGLKDMKHDRKTVWIYPNLGNCNRCPVRLIEKYLSLCPAYYRKANFYLKSLQKPGPKQWYCEQVVGQNTIGKVVQTLMKDAKIEGYFTNHSARHTGGTRPFRAGVDRKLVKEATGHTSDAVDKYQITSDEQCAMMSCIIAGNQIHVSENCENECPKADKSVTNTVSLDQEGTVSNVAQTSMSVETSSVGGMINEIIEKHTTSGKTVIKINIEITKE